MKKGQTLAGRYNLQKELGQGLFGDAFLAHDEGSGLTVTVKSFTDRINQDARILADARRNFQLLQNLDHPYIVKMQALEFDVPSQAHFLVREYVEGVTLTEYRLRYKGGIMPLPEAIEICRQVAMALDHAHRSLLHRDLKPNNILVSPSGEVKLINFCLIPEQIAKEVRTESLHRGTDLAIQTHGYMAPEQFFGFPPPGPAADRYALATVFYELVSGRPPFTQPDPQSLMHAVCNTAPPPVREVGKRRNRVINQAMSKDPGKRFPSALAFIDALEASPLTVAGRYTAPLAATLAAFVVTGGLLWFFNRGVGIEENVEQPGLEAESQEALSPDDSSKIAGQRPTVMLKVESRPGGAQVTLDGKLLGITPMTVGQVLRGRYALKLSKEGYGDVVADVELADDTVVDLSLDALLPGESKPPPGHSEVGMPLAKKEAEAGVSVEGAATGTSPDAKGEIAEGSRDFPRGDGGEKGSGEQAENQKTSVPEPVPLSRSAPRPMKDALTGEDVVWGPLPFPSPLSKAQKQPGAVEVGEAAVAQEGTAQEGTKIAEKRDDQQIAKLMKQANRHLQEMRITFPQGNNALENYQAVLAMDPAHTGARKGMQRIASRLLTMAQEDIDEERLSQPQGRNALSKVMVARDLDPANPKIGLLLKEIAEKYVMLAQSAHEKGQRNLTEARLAQASAVAPKDPSVIEAYRKLLGKDVSESTKPEEVPTDKTESKSPDSQPAGETGTSRDENPDGTPGVHPLPETAKANVNSPPRETEKATGSSSIKGSPTLGSVWKDPVTGMEFVEITEGCFFMGNEDGDQDESPRHKVCLNRYRISKLEVTQGVWKGVMGANNNPSKFAKDDRLPVDSVSWNMAMEFIQRLNEKAPVVFRLPTEAEWENACRASGSDPYQFGTSITTNQANFNGSQPLPGEEKGVYRNSTLPVGSFPANRFGLHDMHGNVYEWVEDWYVKDYYGRSPEENPLATDDSSFLHVLRGGAWHSNSGNLRCGYRYRGRPDFNNFGNGFRLASSNTGG